MMRHLGDITKIDGRTIEPVWCITGGSPCQDLSVAGKRAGLDGERSGLFMEQVRIVKEMRENVYRIDGTDELLRLPRYMVWENVAGAFSSGQPKGADFRVVLEEIARVVEPDADVPLPAKWEKAGVIIGNGYSIAWRLHDAQYFGVPQRRRRIALVADFDGYTAPDIVFERAERGRVADTPDRESSDGRIGNGRGQQIRPLGEGLPRHNQPLGEQGEATAGDAQNRVGASDSESDGVEYF